jgi:FkbM family methyltransferase
MKLVDGWWCPDIMDGPGAYLRRAASLPSIIDMAPGFRSCVQAGGHIGIHPRMLSERFQNVYTFEPELRNFQCLVANVTSPNVYPARGFLGSSGSRSALREHSRSTGGHSIGAAGAIPSYRIDDLHIEDVDAMFIDVEGYEHEVLNGAMHTIGACLPLLVLEENKKMHRFGRQAGDLLRMVARLGYRQIRADGEDIILSAR